MKNSTTIFFLLWNIQFLDLNFEFLINNSRKKWKTITLRANYAVCLLLRLLLLLPPSTDWFRHRCIYYFNILSRMNETSINIFLFSLYILHKPDSTSLLPNWFTGFQPRKASFSLFCYLYLLVYSSSHSIFYTFCYSWSSVCGC